ncbi:MAG: cytochrome c nitrite reductase small subunit [Phycisphaerales bacterium]|nr:cytochrome c nitrite reductase small subunit [Planctomycetota bacterium]
MRKWLPAGFAGIALAAVIGIFLGVSAYTFTYAEGFSYLSDDPKACINCHIMNDQYHSWSSSSHHSRATCNDCHVPHDSLLAKYSTKAIHGYRHSKGFTFQDFHEPIQITRRSYDDVIGNCVRCHEDMTHDIRLSIADVPGAPASAASSVDCIHCHASVAHGPTR